MYSCCKYICFMLLGAAIFGLSLIILSFIINDCQKCFKDTVIKELTSYSKKKCIADCVLNKDVDSVIERIKSFNDVTNKWIHICIYIINLLK